MGRRTHFSVKIEANLKKDFLSVVQEKGFSTCVIIEALMRAWLEGVRNVQKLKVTPSDISSDKVIHVTVHQNFTRVVGRERRHGFIKNQWQDVDVLGNVHPCNCYDPHVGWFYLADEFPQGPLGHAARCQCSKCR